MGPVGAEVAASPLVVVFWGPSAAGGADALGSATAAPAVDCVSERGGLAAEAGVGPAVSWTEDGETEELAGPLLNSGRVASGLAMLVLVWSCRMVDAVSGPPLSLRPEMLESPLGCRCRPMRPSFSMATKLVRTLERGRGESLASEGGRTS